MKCENCGHEQASGKFCGKCGNVLTAGGTPSYQAVQEQPINTAQSAAAAPAYQAPAEPSIHVEKVKETSKQYWNYFLVHLKKPSSILENHHQHFINGLITFGILALLTALGLYDMVSYFFGPVDDFGSVFEQESLKPSFFKILLYTVISVAVVFALSIGSLFAISKFFGPQTQIKSLVAMFGTYLIPVILVMLASYLLLLIDSRGVGSSLFFLGLLFSIFILPLFLITTLVSRSAHHIDAFYSFIAYIVLFTVGLSIVLTIFADSSISNFMAEIMDYSSF
ncbi:hypothetical protein [Planococcus sp. YIM B11945]|uniref:hypothetical protein n=1 Tax=Planococcus sp. YIM B11945 TaxID=3435410 RepID=UPI003D7C8C75